MLKLKMNNLHGLLCFICLTLTLLPAMGMAAGQNQTAGELEEIVMPNNGGDLQVSGVTYYAFTPETSGRWIFTTSGNDGSDPVLTLSDSQGNVIASDDDSAGSSNAYIAAILEAGVAYSVHAGFYNDNAGGKYTLSVSLQKDLVMPGNGGDFQVSGVTYYAFTPETSGRWIFTTSGNDGSDPVLTLSDGQGNVIASDDDGAGNSNARIGEILEAGVAYSIHAGFYYGDLDSGYTLSVSLQEDLVMPNNGGDLQVSGVTYYVFTPETSGRWVFTTSDNGGSDPVLTLSDGQGNVIASDDDGAGNSNAHITALLEAEATYSIHAGFYYDDLDSGYTLSVSLQEDLVIPGNGGETTVNGVTYYTFTPELSGRWIFSTSGNGGSDPRLTLSDSQGNVITYDDDGAGDSNARIGEILEAGVAYSIHAGFYNDNAGGKYTLSVSLQEDLVIPGNGGDFQVNGASYYAFTPETSGRWTFTTSDNGGSDPRLTLSDAQGNVIASDDDSAGSSNAHIAAILEAGATYSILANFYDDDLDSGYTLSASLLDDMVTPWNDGDTLVSGVTYYTPVSDAANYAFTPETSGRWVFITSNNGNSDPRLTLSDAQGNVIASDDDSAGNSNARINEILEAGAAYSIRAGFYDDNAGGNYMLNASLQEDLVMPGNGGDFQVSGASYYVFTPETSGRWIFTTSDNGGSDPRLTLSDAQGNVIASDDDGAGDYNALISEILEAGVTYSIRAGFYDDNAGGNYTLSVSPLEALTIPGNGGAFQVSGIANYKFTPNTSGRWTFTTSENGDGDPVLTLSDGKDDVIAYDDDGAGDYNALISEILEAGVTYSLDVSFLNGGSCKLTVRTSGISEAQRIKNQK